MSDYQGNIIIKNPAVPTGPSTFGRAPGMWKLSEVAYWIKQGVWPNPAVVPDPQFPYVSLLLSSTSLGNANNNLFVDSSGAFNPVSRFGNTTQGSFTPYATNWSNFFDGNADWLSVADNAAFGFGTGDFTIEAWVFCSFNGAIQTIVDGRPSTTAIPWALSVSSTGLARSYDGTVRTGGQLTANQWNHVAWVRVSGVNTVYVNGTLGHTWTNSGDYGSSRPLFIGRTVSPETDYFNGYISNFRIVKGTAVYTANFTVPTSPLTAISGTSLLTCQSNRFRDASSNNFTVTPNGNTAVQDFGPFSPTYPGMTTYNQSDITNWSGYFDNNGDSLSVPNNTAFDFGTGDFTVECWVYLTQYNSATYEPVFANAYLFYIGGTGQIILFDGSTNPVLGSAGDVPVGSWNHIAWVRSGSGTNNTKAYVNGVLRAQGTVTGSIGSGNPNLIGQYSTNYFPGYISNFRVVKGTAVYTSAFTPPTTNLTAISGTSLLTCQNAAFTDNSTNNFVITQNGNPTVSGNSPFNTVGYWSNYFNGGTDRLQVPVTSNMYLGTTYTIEAWVCYTGTSGERPIFSQSQLFQGGFTGLTLSVATSGTVNFSVRTTQNGTVTFITGPTLPPNTWVHVAASVSAGSARLFVNGVQAGSTTTFPEYPSSVTTFVAVGGWGNGWVDGGVPTGGWIGYISNLRVVKGTAVYTSNFTPPTAPLTAISGTVLLTCQNGSFIDNSSVNNTLTPVTTVSAQSFDPFYTSTIASNGGSMYFDGNGDYVSTVASQSTTFGSSDFTIDLWVYSGANSTSTRMAGNGAGAAWGANKWVLGTGFSGYPNKFFFSVNNTGVAVWSSTNANDSAWHHMAVTRSGNTWRLFIDGVLENTLTSSASFDGGVAAPISVGSGRVSGDADWAGYISNFRMIKGTALYTSNFTPPTAPPNPTPATGLLLNGMNAGIYDATTINDMETLGDTRVTTSVSKFGGSSVYFDGTTDYMVVSGNKADWTWVHNGLQNWTIEFWAYNVNTNDMGVFCTNTNSIGGAYGAVMGLNLMNGAGSIGGHFTRGVDGARMDWYTAGNILSPNQWNHVALQFNVTTKNMEVYLNGVSRTVTNQNVVNNSPTGGDGSAFAYSNEPPSFNPNLGRVVGGVTVGAYFNGYMEEMRITRGIRRYTANFTPPTQPFPIY